MVPHKSHEKIGVLHLITGLGIGGAENVVYDLAINTNSEKFDVYVKSMLSSHVELLSKFKDAKIDTEVLGIRKNPIKFVRVISKLDKFINKHEIKILHIHMFHSIILAFFLKFFHPKIKIVFTYHISGAKKYVREAIIFLLLPIRDIDIIFSDALSGADETTLDGVVADHKANA